MGRAEALDVRSVSRLLLRAIPGVAASAVAAFVIYAIHVSRPPQTLEQLSEVTPQSDELSAEERRGLTRQMLKERRENPQQPAEVRPTPRLSTAEIATVGEAKPRPDRAPVVRLAARTRPDAATPAAVTVPLPPQPPSVPASTATAPGEVATSALSPKPPGEVNTQPGGNADVPRRGLAANVFSTISVFAGTAVNATGNTVNWVIDLPGRAISAGGRLIGGNSSTGSPPTAPPPSKRS